MNISQILPSLSAYDVQINILTILHWLYVAVSLSHDSRFHVVAPYVCMCTLKYYILKAKRVTNSTEYAKIITILLTGSDERGR